MRLGGSSDRSRESFSDLVLQTTQFLATDLRQRRTSAVATTVVRRFAWDPFDVAQGRQATLQKMDGSQIHDSAKRSQFSGVLDDLDKLAAQVVTKPSETG